MFQRLFIFFTVIGIVCMVGCATTETGSENKGTKSEKEVSSKNIPPNSPMAKIERKMGRKQVTDILGQPDDTDNYSTGKSWIPFYHGSDYHRYAYYYKGKGRVVFILCTFIN